MNNSFQQQQVVFCRDLVSSLEKEIKMYTQCIELTTSQIQCTDEENELESLSNQIRLFQDLFAQAESDYFDACAELWIAQADLDALQQTD